MSKNLTIIAHIKADKQKVEFLKDELIKLIEPTLKEKGCIRYELNQDNENEDLFIFVESWQTRELWQDHMQSDHIKVFIDSTKDALLSLDVQEMSEVE
jgi:quinol monooxygenase YgiN